MRRAATLILLFAALTGCAAAPQSRAPLAVHDETLEPRAELEVCYELIFCPLVSAVRLPR
ncbi:hypothetical protein [Pseudomonas subflava]|uniref:hypothetical protein n=1 Tax=Pseudomonas subflava TaxID=2952933 RepID=UPI0020792FC3|nr:hypothetical protein [Pseudomonas subflava]